MSRATRLPSGLEVGQLADLARQTFEAVSGRPAGEAADAGWSSAADWAVAFYLRNRDEEVLPAALLADRVYAAFHVGLYRPHPPLADAPAEVRLLWEAVARCLFGAIVADPEALSDVADVPRFWSEWAERRYAQLARDAK